MIYLIYGEEDYLIKKELNNIINNSNVLDDNIVRYDLNSTNVSNAIEDALTISMFSDKKIVICENCSFLTSEIKKDINHDLELLSKYINDPYENSYMIFIVKSEKLDERKKIVKELKRVSKVIECKRLDSHNLNNYIYNYFKENGFEINIMLVRKIVDKVKFDLANIMNECDKLMLYKNNDKVILKEDIDNVIIQTIENNIFELTTAILNKDNYKALNIYNDLKLMGEEPIKLIIMISNQLRLILQTKLMLNLGYKETEMTNIIKEHPYRIKLALSSDYNVEELINNIKKLYKLDYDIKSGNIDKNLGLELYLLGN